MTNAFYTPTGNPAANSEGLSSLIRAEFALIADGFSLFPQIITTGNYTTTFAQVGNNTYTLPFSPGTLALVADLSPLAAKVNPTLTGLHEVAVSLPAANIDCNAGNIFTKTVTTNTTFTVSNVPAAGVAVSFILELTNAGAYTITWWSGIRWPYGNVPILTTSGVDVLGFYTTNGGSVWNAFPLGKGMA